MKKNVLSTAINTVLGVTAAAMFIPTSPAFAQEDATPVEEVLVTGSRIARDPLSTTGPITLISAADIQRSGVGTIDELLNRLPSIGTNGINANTNNGGAGLSFIDLRNLGSNRTLVLVNNRRYVSSTSSVSSAVDLNNIPVDMIERIEVLTDGASAVYGADAVAGVVNIVMKDTFEGVRISARGGTTSKGDGENGELSITFGGEGERGKFIGNISHSTRNSIAMQDRQWANITSTKTPNGNIYTPYGNFAVSEDGLALAGDTTKYDIGQYMWLAGAMERSSVNFSGTYTLSDSVEAFGEASYTHKVTNQQLAAQPMDGSNGFEIDARANLSDELQAELEQKWRQYVDKTLAENPNANAKDDVPKTWYENLNLYIRPVAGGPRESQQTTDTYRLLGGLRGEFSNGWSWNTFASYAENKGKNVEPNNYDKDKLQQILDGKTNIDPVIHGSLSSDFIQGFRFTDYADNQYKLINLGADFSGEIDAITFQGGALGFAAGVEYRKESGEFNPSEETVSGSTFGNQQDATGGDYSVAEAFAEFKLPILEGATFAEELTADLALRYSDFDNFGGQNTGKLGLVYAPVESLRFRASLSNSYRAPGIYELYSGNAQSYPPLIDPCSTAPSNTKGRGAYCDEVPLDFKQAGDQLPANIGGNSELTPEEATTFTTGLVWTPGFVDDLSITLDYFDISIDNAIQSPEMQGILDDCYRKGLTGPCSEITRDKLSNISNVNGIKENVGRVDTRGIDLDITQNIGFNAGQLALRLQATHLLEFTEYNERYDIETDYTGIITDTLGIYPEWRGLASAIWYANNWDAGLELNHIGGGETVIDTPVSERTYVNLKGGWDISDAMRLSAGVDNLTGLEPQDLSGNGAFAPTYDVRGRYFWTGISYQF